MAEKFVETEVKQNKVVIFSKTYCPFCKLAKEIFDSISEPYKAIELDKREDGEAIQDYLKVKTGSRTVPKVFVNEACIGGGSDVKKLHDQNKLVPILKK